MATKEKKVTKADHESDVAEKELDYPGQTETVSDAVKQLADMTWEERQAFAKRVNEVVNQEADKRSVGHDFDTAAYN